LLDKNRSLRETAIFNLKKAGCDVASIYREKLSQSKDSVAALSGLVECGDHSDIGVFVEYLNSPFASRRTEAIRGIGRVGTEPQAIELKRYLLDPSPRVVREAKKQLQQVSAKLSPDELLQFLTVAESQVGKQIILRMLFDLGRWRGLGYLVRAAAIPDQVVSDEAKRLLSRCFSAPIANRVFTRPSGEQREQIQSAVNDSQHALGHEYLKTL
jgi:HEAT repeat protein